MVLLTAVLLILSFSTVVLAVAAENARDAAAWVGTFELTGQANVNVCGAVTQAEQHNDTSNRCEQERSDVSIQHNIHRAGCR